MGQLSHHEDETAPPANPPTHKKKLAWNMLYVLQAMEYTLWGESMRKWTKLDTV